MLSEAKHRLRTFGVDLEGRPVVTIPAFTAGAAEFLTPIQWDDRPAASTRCHHSPGECSDGSESALSTSAYVTSCSGFSETSK